MNAAPHIAFRLHHGIGPDGLPPPVPGRNLDRINVAAGLRELTARGYRGMRTRQTIEDALRRHARGETVTAERCATDPAFHGIDAHGWAGVLAAARAGATPEARA